MPATLPTTPESLLPLVLQAMSRAPDARLRELMAALASHLHHFVIEQRVSEREFVDELGPAQVYAMAAPDGGALTPAR